MRVTPLMARLWSEYETANARAHADYISRMGLVLKPKSDEQMRKRALQQAERRKRRAKVTS